MNRTVILPSILLGMLSMAACSAPADSSYDDESDEALTSLTALARTLKLQSVVFVPANATDDDILDAAKKQNQSAFGALRTASVGVNDRELASIDPSTFIKSHVTVYDVAKGDTTGTPMLRVTYKYTDHAVVPKTMSKRSALSIAVLAGDYETQLDRITNECTANDSEAKEFRDSIWYVFDPSLDGCKTAMAKEQKIIDADRAKITDKSGIPRSELNRLYSPLTVSLTRAKLDGSATYPEYDRLYSGGVVPGKLVVGMVSGLMADWAAGEHHDTIDDEGYDMWFGGLRAIFAARPGLTLVKSEPSEDFTSFTVSGKKYSVPGGINDILTWELDGTGFPAGTSATTQHALRVAAGEKIVKHWLTFEAPVTVTIGSKQPKAVTIQLNSYFGAETDPTPHKRAIKNSDVFIYNGHSYIGRS